MSISFSDVILSDRTGFTCQFLLEGHPCEDDLRENVQLLHEVNLFDFPIQVSIQQYYFMTNSHEENTNDDHFALIRAYDELANLCNHLKPSYNVGTFTGRDDVAHCDHFKFQMEAPHDE